MPADPRRRRPVADPVAAARVAISAKRRRDPLRVGIEGDHIQRHAGREAEALALADSVELDAVMVAEDVAVQVHDLAAMLLHEVRLLEEAAQRHPLLHRRRVLLPCLLPILQRQGRAQRGPGPGVQEARCRSGVKI